MAYKIKKKEKKVTKLTKKQKMAILHHHAKKEKYPKYAGFFGKERRTLVNKMNKRERKKFMEMDVDILEVSTVTDFISIGGVSILIWGVPTLILTIPVSLLSSRYLKQKLKLRREYLEKMHKKYYGWK